MAYFESITAGRGGLDSFNQALNNKRYANLLLNESMGNFANTIANAGSLFDNAKIREEALKYQRMQDFYNNKRKNEAFELQKRQAEQSMDFAKRQQHMSEEMHRQNKRLNEHRIKAMEQANRLNEDAYQWLKTTQSTKPSALVGNSAKETTTPKAPNQLKMPTTQTPKTITKEEFQALYANPFFRY